LNEPSVVAIRQDRAGSPKSVAAVGHEAKQMLGVHRATSRRFAR
jgi:rod shape-determining protein MreB